MATYAIGDLQGCYDPLEQLLGKVNFDPAHDTLWFAGDLVNRGPDSLKTLRFVKSLGESAVTVLGNHDIHLLALYYGLRPRGKDPTLTQVLDAPDVAGLIQWLQTQPLVHVQNNFVLVHAGLHPEWPLDTALQLASEINRIVSALDGQSSLAPLYGASSGTWSDNQHSDQRLRYALNCFTRMRFCSEKAEPDFKHSCRPGEQPDDLQPWYSLKNRPTEHMNIIFGHWAALGLYQQAGIYALDSGCVWGKSLTALRLEDLEIFSVSCSGRLKG